MAVGAVAVIAATGLGTWVYRSFCEDLEKLKREKFVVDSILGHLRNHHKVNNHVVPTPYNNECSDSGCVSFFSAKQEYLRNKSIQLLRGESCRLGKWIRLYEKVFCREGCSRNRSLYTPPKLEKVAWDLHFRLYPEVKSRL